MKDAQKRTQIVEFAKNLQSLALTAPDGYSKKDLNRCIHFLRQRYAVPSEKKREVIIHLLADGLTSFDELREETGYTRHQISRELSELKNQEKVREMKLSITGKGRPAIRYFLTAEYAAQI